MKIHCASDHAGFKLKEELKVFLTELGHEVVDYGTVNEDSCDYPDFIIPCAQAVATDPESFGIILGGSGQGEAMCANRISGVRAAVYYGNPGVQVDSSGATLDIISSMRMHNDANILSLGARFITLEEAQLAVQLFIGTAFSSDERHVRRLGKF